MTCPPASVPEDEESKSYQAAVACLLECSQGIAAIRNRFFRCCVAVAHGISCCYRLKEFAALLHCAVLLHNGLGLLDDCRHFVHRTAQRQQLVNLKIDPLLYPLCT